MAALRPEARPAVMKLTPSKTRDGSNEARRRMLRAYFDQPTDLAVVAVGTRSNPILLEATPQLKCNKWGYVEVDDNGETSIPNVFAGGDIVTGAATVILAMGAGRVAAKEIARRILPA